MPLNLEDDIGVFGKVKKAFKETGEAGIALNDALIKLNAGEMTQPQFADFAKDMTPENLNKILKKDNERNSSSYRSTMDNTIDEVVDEFWEGDKDFKKLLKETAAHEAHYGKLDKVNPMRVDPIQREEMKKSKYQPALGHLGAKRTKEGDFDKDLRTNIILSAMKYLTHPKWQYGIDTQVKRAQVWKDLYNTKEGKGTPAKFLESQKIFDMVEK